MPAGGEVSWVVNPDVVSTAIKQSITHVTVVLSTLSSVMVVFGAIFVYIWREHNRENKEMGARLEAGIKELGTNLKEIAQELFKSRNEHDHRLTRIETHLEECNAIKNKHLVRSLLGDKDEAANP